MVRPRVGGEGTRPRRPISEGAALTSADLRATRASLGLSRAKLAEVAGIGRDTLMDFENGKKVPQARTLAKLSEALEDLCRWDGRSR